MGKHKKFLKSEKAKVKLKGGTLAKGLNITKTEFKVKKIVLREQIQGEKLESGKKKHNVKEVLTRLKHHNTSHRTEALKNLKDCFQYNLEEVNRNIYSVVQGIVTLSLDIEKDVRRQAFKVLSDICITLNSSILEPFFNIISSYLKCAMSHLNQFIQEDSLLFLDVVLIYLPKLIVQNHDQIFVCFIDMISNLRSDSKPGRMLLVNLGKKTTSIKWRSKILDRIQTMLSILVKDLKKKSSFDSVDDKLKELCLEHLSSPFFPLQFENLKNDDLDFSNIFNKSIRKENIDSRDNGEKTKHYIKSLLPLLIESWMEVKPNVFAEDRITTKLILSSEAAITLNTILEIMVHLWEMVDLWEKQAKVENSLSFWFEESYSTEFLNQFFINIPYQQAESGDSLKNKIAKNTIFKNNLSKDVISCSKQNITLIYLFNKFCKRTTSKNCAHLTSVLIYLQYIIANNYLMQDNFYILDKALRSTLLTNAKYYISVDDKNCKILLKTIIDQYINRKLSKKFSQNIVILFCDIVLSENNLMPLYGQNEFSSWLSVQPKLLLQNSISERVLMALVKLGKQKNQIFLKSLGEQVENIIENIEKIDVSDCISLLEGKKLIMSLFYWVDFCSSDIRENLVNQIDLKISDKSISNYFKFIIKKSCCIDR